MTVLGKTLARSALATALAAPAALFTAQAAVAEDRQYILTTAGTGGTFYPVGVALATLAKMELQDEYGIDMSAISSAGSGENIGLMRDDQAQFGIYLAIFGMWGREGSGVLEDEGPQENLRSIALLWPSVKHYLLANDHVIDGTASDLLDFDGTFSIGARNSGTEHSARFQLGNFGIDVDEEWDLVYQGFSPSVDSMIDGQIDGMMVNSGFGVGSVTQAMAQAGDRLTLLSFTEDEAEAFDGGLGMYFPITIPAETYPGQDDEIDTIAQPNFLAVNEDVSEEDVYLFTKAIYENLGFLCNIHIATCDMSLDNAMAGLPLPLHPGAARFYEEEGLDIPEAIAPID